VFARGDERLSNLIEKAWASGCRLDGWSEMFDFNAWTDAMDKTGIDGAYYAEKRFDEDERLPWDNIDIGVRKDFLCKEYERAMSEERTSSCLKTCTNCGLKCVSQVQTADSQKRPGVKLPDYQATAESRAIESKVRVRVQFAKKGLLRYLSHLELVTSILRALRRAGVRLDFSKGFHPAPRVSFGPSLSVGVAGEREYFDMEVFTPFDIKSYMTDINGAMPEGIRVNKMAVVPVNELSLSNFIRRYEYNVSSDSSRSSVPEKISAVNKRLLNGEGIILQRDGKDVDIAPCIEKINIIGEPGGSDNRLDVGLTLRDNDTIRVRIGEITEAIFGINMRELDITRTAVYGWKDGWVEPI
ncbi:MAG: DUF2344 domain-containing protein, partial [Nitrospirae bacterium]|nr:DUF2344 domain-containing protein [Nitrospirota bacterium]